MAKSYTVDIFCLLNLKYVNHRNLISKLQVNVCNAKKFVKTRLSVQYIHILTIIYCLIWNHKHKKNKRMKYSKSFYIIH